ncbi:MAG: helix-turn-helix domain-containing protein [Candidatus Bathyarchaeia archaeon]
MVKLENIIVSTLESSDDGLTLAEIAERVGQSEKKVYKALRKLFQKDVISSENRRYRLSNR